MEELRQILEEIRPDIDFNEEKKLIDDEILDSFDIIAAVSEINEHYSIMLNIDDLLPENFNSIEAIYDLICRMQDE